MGSRYDRQLAAVEFSTHLIVLLIPEESEANLQRLLTVNVNC